MMKRSDANPMQNALKRVGLKLGKYVNWQVNDQTLIDMKST